MDKIKNVLFALLNGLVCFFFMFYFIPLFFMKGVADYIWILMMIVLPLVLSILFLSVFSKCSNFHIAYSILVECLLVIILYKWTGNILDFDLGSFGEDFFDWVGYIIYVFGWLALSNLIQFVFLKMINKIRSYKENKLSNDVEV